MNKGVLINWGSYDIDNLGDLLFPLLIEHFFSQFGYKIVHVSPTGLKSRFEDTISTITIKDSLKYENIKGLLVGGGNLISWTKSSAIPYNGDETLSKIVHPSFFLIPYILNGKYHIPYFFNFIGVSKPIIDKNKYITKLAVENSEYFSCRDLNSYFRLKECNVKSEINVGLDSAFLIDNIYPKELLMKEYNDNIISKYKIPRNKKTAVIYIKKRYFNNEYKELNEIIKVLNSQGVHPIFISLSLCFGDEEILDKIDFKNAPFSLIKKPKSILEIISIISASHFYIGSSLHGGIVSLSYGNRAIFIADELKSRIMKISGFLEQVNLSSSLFKTWSIFLKEIKTKNITTFKELNSQLKIKYQDLAIKSFRTIDATISMNKIKNKNHKVISNNIIDDIIKYYKI